MISDSIDARRPASNRETPPRRRSDYNYADHGVTDRDDVTIGDNGNGDGKGDNQRPRGRKPGRKQSEVDELDAALSARNSGRQWITCYSICTRMAGGGIAALVLSRLVFWLSEQKSGAGPRAKPLPDLEHTAWVPGYSGLAKQIGLIVSNPVAARMQVQRAVDSLVTRKLVEVSPGIPRAALPEEVRSQTLAPSDSRESTRNRIWLHEECKERLHKAGLLKGKGGAVKCVKVWLEHVRQHGANKAIVLGALHYQFFELKEKRLRITHKGEKWWVCSAAQMAQETGLSKGQARSAIEALVEEGCILRDIGRFSSSATSYLRPSFPPLLKECKKRRKRPPKK